MKKRLNKLKKKYTKKLETIKEHLKAQAFYLKHVTSELAGSVVKGVVLGLFIIVLTLSATTLHDKYIESIVGSNVVYIRSPEGARIQGSATGFEVRAPSGKVYTLTNAHVCELQKDGLVLLEEKRHSGRLIPKRVLEVYEDNDLCLVEGLDGYEGLKLGDSNVVGQHGWAVGYPLGQGLNISSGRIKGFGDVSILDDNDQACQGKNKKKTEITYLFFQIEVCEIIRFAASTDVPTFPGNSGSPLVDFRGNVIGVMFASQRETNWGSAVPIKVVKEFLKPY